MSLLPFGANAGHPTNPWPTSLDACRAGSRRFFEGVRGRNR